MVFPYLTLQAYEIGMTYGDVSIIYGIIPFFTFISSPISGIKNLKNKFSTLE